MHSTDAGSMNEFVKKVSQKISKLSPEQLKRLIYSVSEENNVLLSSIESLSTGLMILDMDFRCLKSNKTIERFLPFKMRLNDDKSKKQHIWDLVDDKYISEYLHSCFTDQKTNVSEEFSIASDNKVRFVTIKVLPLVQKSYHEDGDSFKTSIIGSIVSVDDITDKRQQEVLLHRMESLASLTNLAASVAHEIKNPLGAIGIHIQLLQKAVKKSRNGDGLLPNEKFMEKYLDVINEEIDNLNKIVIDFLFAVRPLQVNMVLSDPDSIIEKICDFFKPEFDSKGCKIKLDLCKNSPRLMIDEKLFREVVVNLSQNALAAVEEKIKADKSAGNELTYELLVSSRVHDEKYILCIEDNGSGMDEKTASKIFEPYYTTKVNGTGLGLTMVYKIIKEFKGDIDVKSEKGKGTVFTIVLPVPQRETKLLEDRSEK